MSTPKTIQAAAQALAEASAVRARIAQALADLPDAASPQDALEAARREHESTAAALALGEVDAAAAKAAAKALEAAAAAVAAATAKADEAAVMRAGLSRRLADADAKQNQAAAALAEAQNGWLRAELVRADAQYAEAARAAWSAWTRVAACRAVLAARSAPFDALDQALTPPHLPAAGPTSAQAARDSHPSEPHGWGLTVTPRFDDGAARSLLDAELAGLAEQPIGMLAKARAAIAKATA